MGVPEVDGLTLMQSAVAAVYSPASLVKEVLWERFCLCLGYRLGTSVCCSLDRGLLVHDSGARPGIFKKGEGAF